MRKYISFFLMLLLSVQTAFASILPAAGTDEDFLAYTGIECTPAVVLCESLSILDARGDQGGQKTDSLYYSGETIPVIESWDGYAKIYYANGSKTGWVNNEYLMMNPQWYVCDEDMQVYAYPESMAPRIAWLEAGTRLPILTEYDDEESISGWVCVSLRGAAGWIRKTPADTADETWFRPENIQGITSACLAWGNERITLTDTDLLDKLTELLIHAEDQGAMMAGCPFTVTLTLTRDDGNSADLLIAADSCCVYRVDGRDYAYARHLWSEEEGSPDNSVLFALFGIEPQVFWP